MLHTIREIAFIASDIPEGQTLISGIKEGIETAILDPNQDAIEQIGETIKGKKYSAIHHIRLTRCCDIFRFSFYHCQTVDVTAVFIDIL